MQKTIFKLLGFLFMIIAPIIMFGGVIPYTHEGIAAGLTTMGYIAVAVVALIAAIKCRSAIKRRKESLARGLLLSIFPIGAWLLVRLGTSKIASLAVNIAEYWDRVLIFIVIGAGFYIAAEAMGEDKE